jgi:hypothetical protein
MRSLLTFALLGLFWSSSVQASTLWRYEQNRVPAFVQKKLPGHECRQVKQAASPPRQTALSSPMVFSHPSLPAASSSGLPPLPPGLSASATKLDNLPLSLPGTSEVSVNLALPVPTQESRIASGGSTSRGTIYRRVVNGVVEFSSKPVSGGTVALHFVRQCYACNLPRSVSFQSLPLDTQSYMQAIATEAGKYALDPAWVRAIVHAESNFNPSAVSPKGAQGLMQLMPATARRFGVSAPFEPAQNIAGGVQYLAWLLKRFNGDHRLATAAYNAGEGAVDRYNGVPPYSETRLYVDRVSTLRERYQSNR